MGRLHTQAGSTLVEVLVAIALAGIMLPTLAEAMLTSQVSRPNAERYLRASSLEREAFEAVRIAREASWANVSTTGTYHPVRSGNTWALAAGSEVTSGFTRQINIYDAMRSGSGQIVSSGGTTDPSTKRIAVTISWTTPLTSSISGETYLTQWQNSTTWIQTTQADFTAGTLTNTVVAANGDGSVELTPGSTSGTYESTTFDAGVAASFNNLSFTTALPAGTTIQLQVATSSSPTPGTWIYAGPDGTGSTYYTAAGQIPLSLTGQRYLRFKVILTGTVSTTPDLNDVTVGYSK